MYPVIPVEHSGEQHNHALKTALWILKKSFAFAKILDAEWRYYFCCVCFKRGCAPDMENKAKEPVLEQAEVFCRKWTLA
jgi:hypothetical protein